jgi:hypothetical protein
MRFKAGRRRSQARVAVPKTTCIDGVGHFSGLGAKHGHLARRAPPYVGPVLRFHAAYRRTDPVSSAIQNRAAYDSGRNSQS